LKALLPPEKVKERVHLKPEVCRCGGTMFEQTTNEPLRHQIIDIPPIEPEVIEYVQPIYRCRACGALVYQSLPDQIKRQHFGPGALALVAVLTGMLNTSKLLGAFRGVLVSDRWGRYNFFAIKPKPCEHLQKLLWAA